MNWISLILKIVGFCLSLYAGGNLAIGHALHWEGVSGTLLTATMAAGAVGLGCMGTSVGLDHKTAAQAKPAANAAASPVPDVKVALERLSAYLASNDPDGLPLLVPLAKRVGVKTP